MLAFTSCNRDGGSTDGTGAGQSTGTEQGKESTAVFTYSINGGEWVSMTVFSTEIIQITDGDRVVVAATVAGTDTLKAHWDFDIESKA